MLLQVKKGEKEKEDGVGESGCVGVWKSVWESECDGWVRDILRFRIRKCRMMDSPRDSGTCQRYKFFQVLTYRMYN